MVHHLAARLADLVLATECAACHRPGTRWCARCDLALQRLELGPEPVLVRPRPLPPLMPPTHAAVAYADPVRAAVSAWKDADRRDLVAVLAPMLERSVEAAVLAVGWSHGPVEVDTVTLMRKEAEFVGSRNSTGAFPRVLQLLADGPYEDW